MTATQIANVAGRIDRVRNSLLALVEAMKLQDFGELDIASYDLMVRSMSGLESFDAAAWEAHHERRRGRGDYGPPDGITARSKKRLKK